MTEKPRIEQVILVEGKYDAAKLADLVDALILPVGGFAVFTRDETKALIRRLGAQRGLIILTDSDAAGFRIRAYLNKLAQGLPVQNAYVPAIAGKERRKASPSKEGLLGVEGVPARERLERRRAGSLDERISNIFISIGIPPNIKGYTYLREGIKMAVADQRVMGNVTKGLYPVIGEKYGTTASKVERAIRHAIEVAWNRGRVDAVNAIFGARVYIGTEKPTNSEFIALVADKLILENMV